MVYIIKMFKNCFKKEKKNKVIIPVVLFSEDYKIGYNSAWTNSIKDYWP